MSNVRMKNNFFFSQHYLYDFNKISKNTCNEINPLYNDRLNKSKSNHTLSEYGR